VFWFKSAEGTENMRVTRAPENERVRKWLETKEAISAYFAKSVETTEDKGARFISADRQLELSAAARVMPAG
jgi:hypothetical protein